MNGNRVWHCYGADYGGRKSRFPTHGFFNLSVNESIRFEEGEAPVIWCGMFDSSRNRVIELDIAVKESDAFMDDQLFKRKIKIDVDLDNPTKDDPRPLVGSKEEAQMKKRKVLPVVKAKNGELTELYSRDNKVRVRLTAKVMTKPEW